MVIGITNATNITLENITSMVTNITEPLGFFAGVNQVVYGGILYFILLWVFWFILFMAGQDIKPNFLVNLMVSGGVISVVAFFLRVVAPTWMGSVSPLINDYQMWIFPILTALLAVVVYATRDN